MLLRLITENILSFKEATEFNTFPSSKSQSHDNHKIVCGHATVLRMDAIYGANGAGKSNLIQALEMLQTMLRVDSINDMDFINLTFKLNSKYAGNPSGIAIEFYNNGNVFYYHVEFSATKIIMEELLLSQKNKDVELFTRNDSKIIINPKQVGKIFTEQFNGVLQRIVRPDMLLLSFLGKHYADETPIVADAYRWFVAKLQLVLPEYKFGFVPYLLDTDSKFTSLMNDTLPELKTGISQLKVQRSVLTKEDVKDERMTKAVNLAKKYPGEPQKYVSNDDVSNIIFEDDNLYILTLVPVHKNVDGSEVEFQIPDESDGTRRLIEYMPLLYDIIQKDYVYVVDEIERSLHPIMIKDIIRKISESENAKGQLIFTTHESCLLDQSIFRPDEIWFAQKDVEQATQLYPLSDFNIHKTANIENGYLDGRYGGIPFLSNLKDLNW